MYMYEIFLKIMIKFQELCIMNYNERTTFSRLERGAFQSDSNFPYFYSNIKSINISDMSFAILRIQKKVLFGKRIL